MRITLPEQDTFTLDEAADALGVTTDHIRDWRDSGLISGLTPGYLAAGRYGWSIPRECLVRFTRENLASIVSARQSLSVVANWPDKAAGTLTLTADEIRQLLDVIAEGEKLAGEQFLLNHLEAIFRQREDWYQWDKALRAADGVVRRLKAAIPAAPEVAYDPIALGC